MIGFPLGFGLAYLAHVMISHGGVFVVILWVAVGILLVIVARWAWGRYLDAGIVKQWNLSPQQVVSWHKMLAVWRQQMQLRTNWRTRVFFAGVAAGLEPAESAALNRGDMTPVAAFDIAVERLELALFADWQQFVSNYAPKYHGVPLGLGTTKEDLAEIARALG